MKEELNPVITVKGVAGLGNRLFTLAYALDVAKQISARVEVDWSDGQIGPRGADLFSEYFECTESLNGVTSDWRVHSREGDYVLSTFLTGLLTPLLRMGYVHSAEVWVSRHRRPYLILPLELEAKLRKKQMTCAAHLPMIESVAQLHRIQLKDEVQLRFDNSLPSDLAERIGVHVRHTDKRPKGDVHRLIERVKEEKVFLATDSAYIARLFRESCRDCVLVSTHLHDGNSSQGLHHLHFDTKLKRQVFEEALIDMYALSKTCLFLGQRNSSFSRVVSGRRNQVGVEFWS
jgi:hypothetical protein